MPESTALTTLLALLADPSVTAIRASGRRAEVQRGGAVDYEDLGEHLDGLVSALIGQQLSGAVAVRGFTGFAAVPPASGEPLLVLRRPPDLRIGPDGLYQHKLMTRKLARAVVQLLVRGSGALLAGPRGSMTTAVASGIVQMLPASLPVVIVEDEPRIAPGRDAVRLRRLEPDVLSALGDALLVLDTLLAPPLVMVPPPVLATVRARSPQAACARACCGAHESVGSSDRWAIVLSDTAPLLLWYDASPRLAALYEIMPGRDEDGLCRLQMLAALDPISQALVPTGAVPRDPDLAHAFSEAGR